MQSVVRTEVYLRENNLSRKKCDHREENREGKERSDRRKEERRVGPFPNYQSLSDQAK